MSNRKGSSPEQRERFLELRRGGLSKEEAAREMDLEIYGAVVRRYEHWFALEAGECSPHHNPFTCFPWRDAKPGEKTRWP